MWCGESPSDPAAIAETAHAAAAIAADDVAADHAAGAEHGFADDRRHGECASHCDLRVTDSSGVVSTPWQTVHVRRRKRSHVLYLIVWCGSETYVSKECLGVSLGHEKRKG